MRSEAHLHASKKKKKWKNSDNISKNKKK
jgi:hypothetical protein